MLQFIKVVFQRVSARVIMEITIVESTVFQFTKCAISSTI